MTKLYYQEPGTWFGDCMPWAHDGIFYLFHQRDNRNPRPFGEPFGWDLSVTRDFVHYENKGVAIPRGSMDEQDQFIFAGSVFEAEGSFHAFYTGYNRDYEGMGKNPQVLMHAVSNDLIHWEKTQDALTFSPQEGYDPGDWRDPFVLWNEEESQYLLLLGTRKSSPKTAQTGCTVYFTSPDLKNWEFKGDFFSPGLYTMHEMPDLFRIGDWWYHVISEYSDRDRMIYRMSKSIYGPWIAPKDDAFDGRAYYAARTCAMNGRRFLFGWVPTREGCADTGNFEWAGTFMAHEVYQRADGTLGVKVPDEVWNTFEKEEQLPDMRISSQGERTSKILDVKSGDIFRLEATISLETEVKDFGLRFYENTEDGQAYQYHFLAGEERVLFEKNPNWPWYQCMNLGLERPIHLEEGKTYHIQLIVDDTISTLYVNEIGLNARFYTKPGEDISFFVTDGTVTVKDIRIARGITK